MVYKAFDYAETRTQYSSSQMELWEQSWNPVVLPPIETPEEIAELRDAFNYRASGSPSRVRGLHSADLVLLEQDREAVNIKKQISSTEPGTRMLVQGIRCQTVLECPSPQISAMSESVIS